MKYVTKITINKDKLFVSDALVSKEAAFKWMGGLKEFNLVEGNMNEVGSKYNMVFSNKGKTEKMTETIMEFSPPNRITTLYEAPGVWNECVNSLEESNGKTIYTMSTDFKFKFPLNLFIWIFKSKFKEQTMESLKSFKEFCENNEKI
jgi:hypothetical protein